METLHRMAKHLPGRRLLGQLPSEDRLEVDALGTIWVTEDPLLIVLKDHLIIESALIDICTRLLRNPPALERERLGFGARLSLVCALLEPDYFPDCIIHAMRDLNKLRNDLAHNLEPDDFDKNLERFFRRFDEFEDFRPLHEADRTTANQLTGCIAFLCGVLGNIGNAETP